MLVAALVQSTGALATDHAVPSSRRQFVANNALPAIDDHANGLAQRDATTRFHLSLLELCSDMSFDINGRTETAVVKLGVNSFISMKRPTYPQFQRQLEFVIRRARLRPERTPEILTQVQPQYAFWSGLIGLHPDTTPRTIELTYIALHFVMVICQRLKHALATPRPHEYSPMVQPILLAPTYSAWPMGHATEAYMFSQVMSALLGESVGDPIHDQLRLIARRISDNRVIAGVHFPIDSPAGYVLAERASAYFLAKCGAVDPKVKSASIDGTALADVDADPQTVFDPLGRWSSGHAVPATYGPDVTVSPSALLAEMWNRARGELTANGWK
jgi:hypothetical protein